MNLGDFPAPKEGFIIAHVLVVADQDRSREFYRSLLGGQVIASVTGWVQDEYLQLTGSFHMGVGIGVATFDLAESGAGTLLRFSFRAIGVLDAAAAEDMSRGWEELVGTRLRARVETGTRLGIDPDEPPAIQPVR